MGAFFVAWKGGTFLVFGQDSKFWVGKDGGVDEGYYLSDKGADRRLGQETDRKMGREVDRKMGQEAGADYSGTTCCGVLCGEPVILAVWVLLWWEYAGEGWRIAC